VDIKIAHARKLGTGESVETGRYQTYSWPRNNSSGKLEIFLILFDPKRIKND
jgi:hypothetical protein